MPGMSRFLLRSIACAALLMLVACASGNRGEINGAEAISTPIPAESKFAPVVVGWSRARVHDTIGKPTDSRSYSTGKSWIPFYFGSDAVRVEDLYKGEGRIIYAGGTGLGNQGYTVYTIVYDPNESGYNDR